MPKSYFDQVPCQILHGLVGAPPPIRLKSISNDQSFDVARRVKTRIADGCDELNLPLIENGLYLATRHFYADNENVQVRCLGSSLIRPVVTCSCMTQLFGFMYVKRSGGCVWVMGFLIMTFGQCSNLLILEQSESLLNGI